MHGVRVSISSDSVPVRRVEKDRAQEGWAGWWKRKEGFLVYTFGAVESYFFLAGWEGGGEKWWDR